MRNLLQIPREEQLGSVYTKNKMVKNRKDLTPRRSFRPTIKRGLKSASGANIKVVVRVRPHNAKEEGDNFRTVVKVVDNQLLMFDPEEDNTPFFYHGVQQKHRDLLKKPHKNMKFNFDYLFNDKCDNEEVFLHSTKDLIKILMDGCNCSVFVYGATGAGKTHTMLGHNASPGITFLTMRELFQQKEELSEERDFELAVSYLEIYNENVLDLLKPGGPPLHLREDSKLGVMVAGITIKRIENPTELFELLEKGNKNRTQHPTDANAESSRSHAVFQVYIRMNIKQTGQTHLAKLSMIDLAGSERGAATGCKGARFTEGANINKSLLSLGNCINSLADGKKHVPYRDSKLTRLLKDSLGGNCHTVMIANVSPSSMSMEDTYNTLKYATRAKKIKSNVKKNVVNSELNAAQYLKIIDELYKENAKLKEMLKIKEDNIEEDISEKKENEECIEIKISEVQDEEKPVKPPNEMPTKLKFLFENYKSTLERLQKLHSNRSNLEYRLNIKEEANARLSFFCTDTPEKEKGHKKLLQTMDRFKKQNSAYDVDLEKLDAAITEIQSEIDRLVADVPELKLEAELEIAQINLMKKNYECEELQNINKLQLNELNTRGSLMEEMATLLQPLFKISKVRKLTTTEMNTQYTNICAKLQGVCTVSFDDDDSGISNSSSTTSNIVVEEECRPPKRKLPPVDLDSTFILSAATLPNNKISSDYLAKACEPSPAKRLAKCVYKSAIQKENKERKIIGTMGTASRFPLTKTANGMKSNIRPR